ncbi:MAG: hypothetical protein IPI35_10225 [Deltaproteobacteria bacterium]|nr:hypothetical protein [Deltaproteobacteria bacterium]
MSVPGDGLFSRADAALRRLNPRGEHPGLDAADLVQALPEGAQLAGLEELGEPCAERVGLGAVEEEVDAALKGDGEAHDREDHQQPHHPLRPQQGEVHHLLLQHGLERSAGVLGRGV